MFRGKVMKEAKNLKNRAVTDRQCAIQFFDGLGVDDAEAFPCLVEAMGAVGACETISRAAERTFNEEVCLLYILNTKTTTELAINAHRFFHGIPKAMPKVINSIESELSSRNPNARAFIMKRIDDVFSYQQRANMLSNISADSDLYEYADVRSWVSSRIDVTPPINDNVVGILIKLIGDPDLGVRKNIISCIGKSLDYGYVVVDKKYNLFFESEYVDVRTLAAKMLDRGVDCTIAAKLICDSDDNVSAAALKTSIERHVFDDPSVKDGMMVLLNASKKVLSLDLINKDNKSLMPMAIGNLLSDDDEDVRRQTRNKCDELHISNEAIAASYVVASDYNTYLWFVDRFEDYNRLVRFITDKNEDIRVCARKRFDVLNAPNSAIVVSDIEKSDRNTRLWFINRSSEGEELAYFLFDPDMGIRIRATNKLDTLLISNYKILRAVGAEKVRNADNEVCCWFIERKYYTNENSDETTCELQAVLSFFTHSNEKVRHATFEKLTELVEMKKKEWMFAFDYLHSEIAEIITSRFQSDDVRERLAIAKIVSKIHVSDVMKIEILTILENDTDGDVRRVALGSLRKIEKDAIEVSPSKTEQESESDDESEDVLRHLLGGTK